MDNETKISPDKADISMSKSEVKDISSKGKSRNKLLLAIIILLLIILAFLLGYLLSNSSNTRSDNNDVEIESDTDDSADESESDLDVEEEPVESVDFEDPTSEWQTVNFTTVASDFSTLIYEFTYMQPDGDFNQNGDGFTYHTASGAEYEMQFESAYESYPEEFISFTELEDEHPQFGTVYRALGDEDLSFYKYSNDELVGSGLDCDEEPFPGLAPCGSPAIVYPDGAFRLSCTSATETGLEICDLIVGTIEVEVVE